MSNIDKKPNLPMFIPKIGIDKLYICVKVSNKVPSPPKLKIYLHSFNLFKL